MLEKDSLMEMAGMVWSFWYFSDWFQFLEGSDSSNVAIH